MTACWKVYPAETHTLLFLTGMTISSAFQRAVGLKNSVEVGTLLHLFWDTLPEQIAARKYFHRGAPLLQDALIDLATTPFNEDLVSSDVRIDRRMVDYLVGLETEATALVEDSHLYRPTVSLDRVILPEAQKRLIVETVTGFPAFQQARQRYFDTLIEYGRGLVLLFWGPSGSGKTAMANALANHLGKRLFLINYPRIGQMTSDQVMKLLFREAKIHDAVLFFDECDGIFESRERHNEECTIPQSGLDDLIVPAPMRQALMDLIGLTRVRNTLIHEWGFTAAAERNLGATALFYGLPGTGKSLAAEAVAYALGRPLRRVNIAQVTSKWVGETA